MTISRGGGRGELIRLRGGQTTIAVEGGEGGVGRIVRVVGDAGVVIIINEIILFLLNYLPPQIIPLPFLPFVHASSFPHLYLIVALLPTMCAFLAPSSSRLLIARSLLRDRTFLLLPLLRPHRLLCTGRLGDGAPPASPSYFDVPDRATRAPPPPIVERRQRIHRFFCLRNYCHCHSVVVVVSE